MKFNKWTIALAATGVVSLASVAQADEHPVNTALSSTTLSGFVDTSAIWNLGTGNTVANRFANTGSDRQDGFNLNYVKVQLEKPIDEGTWSAGYKTELMFGPDASVMPGLLGGASGEIAIKQAYVALRAPVGNGIDIKIGQFDPIVGYEVTDSYANPNFSRSLAFNNLEPFGHQGVLASYQFNDVLGASLGVANSANNSGRAGSANGGGSTLGNINRKSSNTGFGGAESYKAYMAGLVVKAPESLGWLAGSALYAGVVKGLETGSDNDPVTYYVGGSLATPIKALSVGAAYDYLANGSSNGSYANAATLYLNFQATEKLKLNGRFEYATSSDNVFVTGAGSDQKVIGVTGTADYALFANVVTRVEVRWDTVVSGVNLRAFDGEKNDVSVALNVIYKF